MKQLIPTRVRLEKDVIVRINRVLQGKGAIRVVPNQEVNPQDIIGEANMASGFRTLNLAELLGVNPSGVGKYLKRAVGQRIYRGELLAYKAGGFLKGKKIVIAPTDGVLDYINPQTGELKMTLLPKKIALPAGVYGIVEQVDQQKGQVVIKAQASRIYGMFGCGKLRDGNLEFICKREDLLIKSMISPKDEGHILVGGSLVYKEALTAAISAGINGIIVGGINAKDYQSMTGGRLVFPKKLDNDIGISLVVCEGFGSVPIAEDIYNMLLSYNGRFVSIDGNKGIIDLPSFNSSSLTKVKNTKLAPMPQEDTGIITKLSELKLGVRVRIIGNSYLGEQGKVIAIDESTTLMPSNIVAVLATIETKRRKIKVPVVNLEIMDYI